MKEETTKISSKELSERMRLTASQIRQDLNCFGGFGQQGYGYNVAELRNEIARIIGVEKKIKTVLIGAGNLGKAITMHLDFEKNGCELIGIFDEDDGLKHTKISDVEIQGMDTLDEFCKQNDAKLAILCIPRDAVKPVCERLISLGVKSFWNFSHFDINLHFDGITVENVHLGDSLLTLAYKVNNEVN